MGNSRSTFETEGNLRPPFDADDAETSLLCRIACVLPGTDAGVPGANVDMEKTCTAANLLQEEGRIGLAKNLYKKVLSVDPNHHLACYNLGSICFDEKKYSQALFHFERALVSRRDDLDTSINIMVTLMNLDRLEEAGNFGLKALENYPSNPVLLYNLGNCCLSSSGKIRDAVRHFSTLLQIESAHSDAMFNLAIAHQKLDNHDLALKYYQDAVALDPSLSPSCNGVISALQKKKKNMGKVK
mmetsp:Transcript_6152/g.10842  ORF Transcript_6152/g.10842 Transcript_6152/m.10842 type:complete len:242 (+) Transcript_6152:56-781(+)